MSNSGICNQSSVHPCADSHYRGIANNCAEHQATAAGLSTASSPLQEGHNYNGTVFWDVVL
jgi:hypothetical protein